MELAEFESLESRLPEPLLVARQQIASADAQEETRQSAIGKWRAFLAWAPCSALLYLALNVLPWVSVATVPSLAFLAMVAVLLQMIELAVFSELTKDPGIYYKKIAIFGETRAKKYEYDRANEAIVMILAHPYWLYWAGKVRHRRATEPPTPVLGDNRLRSLRGILRVVRGWDEDVVTANRLIRQANLGIIRAEDVATLVSTLRDDERYLLAQIEYARRLLDEGPLGTRQGPDRTPEQIVETVDARMREIDGRREEARELASRLAARAEVR